ncbi:MAG: acyl-CoA/acyl-ACP dehydrogenase [Acidimicrobiia bacterium]|nr:acyl-CoA/acyl-ACP dehydrogenase [Acidimicrobiia bacterium]
MTTGTTHWTGSDPESRWVTEARDVAARIGEDAADHDRSGDFVHEGSAVLRRHGLTTMLVPEELGGGGATHAETCAVLATLAHGCPATALTLSMHSHLVAAQVWRYRHDLPAPALSKVVDDGAVLVSTGAADWLDSEGTALPAEGGFRVSARKSPSSGAPAGDVLVTSARWESSPEGPQVIHFTVPFAAEGVSIDETWDTMGMRATGSHTVVLDDVFVPEAAVSLVRPVGEWHPVFNVIVGAALPLIMAVYVGVAEEAVERSIALAGRRADTTTVAPLVGRMLNRLHVAQDAVGSTIAMSDDLRFAATMDHAAAVLGRKTVAAEAAIDAVRLAMEAVGGASYSRSVGIERLYRDVHGSLHHPLPAARQELFTGRLALGLDPLGTA